MGVFEVKIIEIRNLTVKNGNGNSPKNIKLKIGNGRIGNWVKTNSKAFHSNGSIPVNCQVSLKYKSKYPNLIIKIIEEGFLGEVMGECKLDISNLYYQSIHSNIEIPSSYYLCIPVVPTFGLIPVYSYNNYLVPSCNLIQIQNNQQPLNSNTNNNNIHNNSNNNTSFVQTLDNITTRSLSKEEFNSFQILNNNNNNSISPNIYYGEIHLTIGFKRKSNLYSDLSFETLEQYTANNNNYSNNNSNIFEPMEVDSVLPLPQNTTVTSTENQPKRKNSLIRNSQKIKDVIKSIKNSNISIINNNINPFLNSTSNCNNNINNNNNNSNNINNNNNFSNIKLPNSPPLLSPLLLSSVENDSKENYYFYDNQEQYNQDHNNKQQQNKCIKEESKLYNEFNNFLIKEYYKNINNKSLVDKLNLVVVESIGFGDNGDLATPITIGCKIKIGLQDCKKETVLKSSNQLYWKQYFEIPLSSSTQRFSLNTQNLVFYFQDFSSEQNLVIAESQELDLFQLERDKILELWLPVNINDQRFTSSTSKDAKIHILLKYETAYLNAEEVSELLFLSLCSKDKYLLDSLLRMNTLNLNQTFKEKNSDFENPTILTKACKQGNYKVAKQILELGASVNTPDSEGFTPIMKCVQYDGVLQPISNSFPIIRLLLDYGADPRIKSKNGDTLLSLCNSWRMREFLQTTIENQFYQIKYNHCSKCQFIEFPICFEKMVKTLRSGNCRCKPTHFCINCNNPLKEGEEKLGFVSQFELSLVFDQQQLQMHNKYQQQKSQASSFDYWKLTNSYIQHCPICKSFGFNAIGFDSFVCNINNNNGSYCFEEFKHRPIQDHALLHLANCTIPDLKFSKVLYNSIQIDNLLYYLSKKSIFNQYSNFKSSYNNNYTLSNSSNNNFGCNYSSALNSINNDNISINNLPQEIVQYIISQLNDFNDIKNCSLVSFNWYIICSDQIFWKLKVSKSFGKDLLLYNNIHILLKDYNSMDDCGDNQLKIKNNNNNNNIRNEITLKNHYYKKLWLHINILSRWVRNLLLEESFKPRFTMKVIPNTCSLLVELTLTATKYLFNKDGVSFNFDNKFKLLLEFSKQQSIESIKIEALDQTPSIIHDLCNLLQIPTNLKVSMEELENHNGTVSLFLTLQTKAIKKWINSYLSHAIPGLHSFLMIRDDVGGSIILDFYYYDIENLVLNPPPQEKQNINNRTNSSLLNNVENQINLINLS
ncbi:hypothetical protein DICPUDRAFT_53058 [Dictyostelium purpureum]|uniref:F-box domain-containing protein n=1 Tax=Dictyostelium purpureum TaxID=5786 RepID=F0ZAZ1_DICPU|nr:uncharacterized protein DICPUDRAFT_53058 [Dictyostelium purpureum]EGC38884.1 hypothetical protein DICPUDRAFT_53058 [Dictyostelium purpureum]|eukprot:XP_003284564.1 hypothetical protein DICPUDRAFT_53058 [Dictyostelium purpureum]